MTKNKLSNQIELEKATEKLGTEAMELGLISNFVVRYFPDCWEFYIESNFFTPPEAYLYLKKLLQLNLNFKEMPQ
ncbi:MAG: hypothetical protein QNJ32_07400 [Xenococcaceae cyanobacterium MO_167.B27]|nr:hypothetical protein [Xenococcaceae cyanobacterium MO_167.B27]